MHTHNVNICGYNDCVITMLAHPNTVAPRPDACSHRSNMEKSKAHRMFSPVGHMSRF